MNQDKLKEKIDIKEFIGDIVEDTRKGEVTKEEIVKYYSSILTQQVEMETVKRKFIREFCNDHGGEVRWLRGVSYNMETLLEDILKFFDKAGENPTTKEEEK